MRGRILSIFLVLFLSSLFARAQFNSGSTGADGALDLATMTCPGNVCKVQMPESGVFNFTTINIPAGRTLRFGLNSRATPVVMLAQGNVTVSGTLDIQGGIGGRVIPGPGGFYGGSGGRPGFGPGGGTGASIPTARGVWVGPLSLVPIVGGSGARGFGAGNPDGGGGGGAIVIASSTSILMSGSILANGVPASSGAGWSGGGGGGAVRLIADSMNISGAINAGFQSCGDSSQGEGGCGVIRLEATNLVFTGSSFPLAISGPINPTVGTSSLPQLTIASIGGYSVPSYSGTRFDLIDLLLPNQIPDPVNVVVSAQNIPTGTQVQVGFVSGSPSGTSTPCNLAGSFESSSCTATISNLTRTGGTYLLATAAFAPPSFVAKYNPKGRDQVAKIKLEAVVGAKPKYTFLRASGTLIDPKVISPQFLKEFGM